MYSFPVITSSSSLFLSFDLLFNFRLGTDLAKEGVYLDTSLVGEDLTGASSSVTLVCWFPILYSYNIFSLQTKNNMNFAGAPGKLILYISLCGEKWTSAKSQMLSWSIFWVIG